MNIHISSKIRQLRKAKNMSQEELAALLGVSFQAVSKWETGAAMPDITLIPAIAFLFGVSTDELFEYNRLENEERVFEICSDAAQYRRTDPERSAAILRNGLKQFPGNDIILNNLLYALHLPEHGSEIIAICKSLIASTHDDEVKYDAIRILADTYSQLGKQDLVEPTLEQLPEVYFTKLEQIALLLEGEKAAKAAQAHMGLCMNQLFDMLMVLRGYADEQGDGAEAEKYRRMKYKTLLSAGTLVLFSCAGILIVPFIRLYTKGITDADYIQPLPGFSSLRRL